MARRLNTIIIVPHSKAKFVKFSFSTRAAIAAVTAVVLGVILSIVAIVYTGSAVSRKAEAKRLRAENRELQKVNEELKTTVTDIQGRLEEFERRTSSLALAAGMSDAGETLPGESESEAHTGRGGPYKRVPEKPEELRFQEQWIAKNLDAVERQLNARGGRLAATPSIAPVIGVLTDGFGRRRDPFTGRPAYHRGIDISARRGTPVMAPADGVVTFTGRQRGFGREIRISHGFGVVTVYGHLSSIGVAPGDRVHRGDVIGRVGSTGRSTGPHLHYEVHVDGAAVNPLYYILNAY
ncbi:MAG: peptidoglycan DD-metalloendopeptidase family protein [Acidobacteria bacterium]|nr:peptidoglycan DD-metalloendopeptidase family protein [Acidobacteriota bacterium]